MSLHSIVVGLLLASFGLPVLLVATARLGIGPARFTGGRIRLSVLLQWVTALAVGAYVVAVEQRPLSSVGVSFDPLVLLGGPILAFAVAGGLYALTLLAVQRLGLQLIDETTLLTYAQPRRWKVAVVVSAGVTEEFLYRGYVLERVLDLTGMPLVAGAASLVLFLVAHVPGRDARAVLVSLGPLSVGLVASYLVLRSVPALAVAHAAINALALYGTDLEDVLSAVDRESLDDRALRAVGAD